MEKVLTISVSAYNVENTIKDTLDSLLSDLETMNQMEVIVVDDGSSDGTALKVKEYVNKYPDTFCLISKENGGYGSTINTSVKVAKGKYFKQLDAGDTFETSNISDFVKYLEQNNADIILGPYIKYYICNKKEELIDNYHEFGRTNESDLDNIGIFSMPYMHGTAFKTSVWNDYGRDIPEKCFYTDVEYTIHPFAKAKSVAFYDKPIYRYYLQDEGQSVSKEGIRKHYKDSVRMMWDICDAYDLLCKKDELKTNNKIVFEMTLKHVIAFTYTLYSIMGKDFMPEIKNIDKELKEKYPDIYNISNSVKRIKLMRKTGFNMILLYVKKI